MPRLQPLARDARRHAGRCGAARQLGAGVLARPRPERHGGYAGRRVIVARRAGWQRRARASSRDRGDGAEGVEIYEPMPGAAWAGRTSARASCAAVTTGDGSADDARGRGNLRRCLHGRVIAGRHCTTTMCRLVARRRHGDRHMHVASATRRRSSPSASGTISSLPTSGAVERVLRYQRADARAQRAAMGRRRDRVSEARVPVIDLRVRFELARRDPTRDTRIIGVQHRVGVGGGRGRRGARRQRRSSEAELEAPPPLLHGLSRPNTCTALCVAMDSSCCCSTPTRVVSADRVALLSRMAGDADGFQCTARDVADTAVVTTTRARASCARSMRRLTRASTPAAPTAACGPSSRPRSSRLYRHGRSAARRARGPQGGNPPAGRQVETAAAAEVATLTRRSSTASGRSCTPTTSAPRRSSRRGGAGFRSATTRARKPRSRRRSNSRPTTRSPSRCWGGRRCCKRSTTTRCSTSSAC